MSPPSRYNTKDPVSMISKNPKLLLNVEEADLEADPLYGEVSTTVRGCTTVRPVSSSTAGAGGGAVQSWVVHSARHLTGVLLG